MASPYSQPSYPSRSLQDSSSSSRSHSLPLLIPLRHIGYRKSYNNSSATASIRTSHPTNIRIPKPLHPSYSTPQPPSSLNQQYLANLSKDTEHTRRQTLLQLIRLVAILEHERVQLAPTPDFEFDLCGLAVAFDTRSYFPSPPLATIILASFSKSPIISEYSGGGWGETNMKHLYADRSR